MKKKHFTESQLILFIIIIGICILVLCIVFNKFISNQKEKQKQDNINNVVEAAKKYFSDKKGNTLYVDVDELVEGNFLSKKVIDGCVKATYQDKLESYNYSYNTTNCKSIMTARDLLIRNITNTKDGLYKQDNDYIFKGKNPNNYIMINNILYRIMELNDSGIKAIRDTIIESRAWDSANVRTNEKNIYCSDDKSGCNAYVANGNEITQDSEIHQYLETVYSKIENKDLILNSDGIWKTGMVPVDYKDSDIDNYISSNTITSNIGLINIKDYINASTNKDYKKNNWLNNGESFWTITSVSNSNNLVWNIDKSGKIVSMSADNIDGVRPILNIKDSINLLGDGTKDSPYILNIVK